MNIEFWEKILTLNVERRFELGVWPRIALFWSAPFRGLQYFTANWEVGDMYNRARVRGYMNQKSGEILLIQAGRYLW